MRHTVTWLARRDVWWMGWAVVCMERLNWAVWPGGAHQSGAAPEVLAEAVQWCEQHVPRPPLASQVEGSALAAAPLLLFSSPPLLSSIMWPRSTACNRFLLRHQLKCDGIMRRVRSLLWLHSCQLFLLITCLIRLDLQSHVSTQFFNVLSNKFWKIYDGNLAWSTFYLDSPSSREITISYILYAST